jgi:hypothetical protein
VKANEGRPAGVRRHARRAAELLDAARVAGGVRFGLSIAHCQAAAIQMAEGGEFTPPRLVLIV